MFVVTDIFIDMILMVAVGAIKAHNVPVIHTTVHPFRSMQAAHHFGSTVDPTFNLVCQRNNGLMQLTLAMIVLPAN